MSQYETLKVINENGVLQVIVNRPDKLNALNAQVLQELLAVIDSVKDFSARVLILSGEGDRAFIAGADIKAMSTMNASDALAFAKLGQDVTLGFENLPIPVIACVHGFALGGGCEMAMSADFIFATKASLFGQPEINLALIPGFGGTQRLMRAVGLARSRELIYTGRNFKADEAHSWGLVHSLFETKEEMMAEALKMAEVFKKKSPVILAECKKVINRGEGLTVAQGLEIERNTFSRVFETADKTEGLAAFLEKRAPNFQS